MGAQKPVRVGRQRQDDGDARMGGKGARTNMRVCSVEGCSAKHLAKGLCSVHYQRFYKRGTLETTVMRGATVVARILAKVTIQPNGCWLFTGGALTSNGYGHIRVGRTMRTAHVMMYQDKYGPVPEGMELDHFFCQQKACCNPDHVEPVTHLENTKRSVAQKTAEHGAWGFGRWDEDR